MNFSILIPTYTGQEHIEKCFASIMNQNKLYRADFEVIVVIDGPNDELKAKVDKAKKLFSKSKIKFKVYQFNKNMGRFDARLKAANLAYYNQLLFVDDRVVLDNKFIDILLNQKDRFIIPNVLEANHPNSVSRLNYLLRRRIYGKKNWGKEFKSFYIDYRNFEKAAKGTTALWIPKKDFINVCERIKSVEGDENNQFKNDDTKLLKLIVGNNKILRSSKLRIYYNPRSKFQDELLHLYKRGPVFVDYYFQPGTRYWPVFILLPFLMLAILFAVTIFGFTLLLPLAIFSIMVMLLLSFYLAEIITDVPIVMLTMPLILIFFALGVLKGLYIKIKTSTA